MWATIFLILTDFFYATQTTETTESVLIKYKLGIGVIIKLHSTYYDEY